MKAHGNTGKRDDHERLHNQQQRPESRCDQHSVSTGTHAGPNRNTRKLNKTRKAICLAQMSKSCCASLLSSSLPSRDSGFPLIANTPMRTCRGIRLSVFGRPVHPVDRSRMFDLGHTQRNQKLRRARASDRTKAATATQTPLRSALRHEPRTKKLTQAPAGDKRKWTNTRQV